MEKGSFVSATEEEEHCEKTDRNAYRFCRLCAQTFSMDRNGEKKAGFHGGMYPPVRAVFICNRSGTCTVI